MSTVSIVGTAIWLLWISLSDIKSRRVPAWLIVGGGAVNVMISVGEDVLTLGAQMTQGDYWGTLLGGIIPGVFLLLLVPITGCVGWGDGAVMTLLGISLGLRGSVLVLCAGLFLAALWSVVLLVLRKANRNTCLPFLPFLTMGWFLVGKG